MGHRSTCARFDAPVLAVAPLLCHVAECVDDKRHVVGRLALIALAMAADRAPTEMHPAARLAHPSFTEPLVGLEPACLPGIHAPYAFMVVTILVSRLLVEMIGVQWKSLATTVTHANAFLAQNAFAAVAAVYAIKMVRV
jgi:hypothetical protein